MYDVRIDFGDLRRVRERIERIMQETARSQRTKTLPEFMQLDLLGANDAAVEADKEFRRAEERLFRTEGSSGGARWRALSPRYKRWKDRLFAGATKARGRRGYTASFRGGQIRLRQNKILTLGGRLRESLAAASGEFTGEHILKRYQIRGRWFLEFGTLVPYARWHHEGRFRLPVRSPIAISADDRAKMRRAAAKALRPHVLRRARLLSRIGAV